MAKKINAEGTPDQKRVVQRLALVITHDDDTGRYYFKVYDGNANLLFAPSDTVWEEAFRKFTKGGYFILLSEKIGSATGIAMWEISLNTPPAKPKKRKDLPMYRTAAAQYPMVVDREEEPKRFYFKVYDENDAPVYVAIGESYGEAREKLKEAGYLIMLDDMPEASGKRSHWKIVR